MATHKNISQTMKGLLCSYNIIYVQTIITLEKKNKKNVRPF